MSVGLFTLSNMNISATIRPIAIKFYLKHHWGGRNAAIGFGLVRIGTLVSMATDSSHRVIMVEHLVNTLAPSFLIESSIFLQVTRTTNNISDEFKIRPDSTKDCRVSCP